MLWKKYNDTRDKENCYRERINVPVMGFVEKKKGGLGSEMLLERKDYLKNFKNSDCALGCRTEDSHICTAYT